MLWHGIQQRFKNSDTDISPGIATRHFKHWTHCIDGYFLKFYLQECLKHSQLDQDLSYGKDITADCCLCLPTGHWKFRWYRYRRFFVEKSWRLPCYPQWMDPKCRLIGWCTSWSPLWCIFPKKAVTVAENPSKNRWKLDRTAVKISAGIKLWFEPSLNRLFFFHNRKHQFLMI